MTRYCAFTVWRANRPYLVLKKFSSRTARLGVLEMILGICLQIVLWCILCSYGTCLIFSIIESIWYCNPSKTRTAV